MNRMLKCQEGNANRARKSAKVAAVLALAAVFSASGVAFAATYDASTGYVTLDEGGASNESPLITNKVTKTVNGTPQLVDAWSDGQAPHSGTNYYAGKQFRTPASSKGDIVFAGGRLAVKTVVLWSGSGDNAKLTFPNGLEVLDVTTLRHNENGPNRRCQIFGPVAFSGNCTVNPSGGDNKNECGFNFYGVSSSPADAVVTVQRRTVPRWGWFGLLGDTTGFLGTVAVESCGYEVGTSGLPNGTVVFTGTNNVLRLIANPVATAPIMKTLRFDSEGPHEIRVAVDGADYGKVRVTNDFSATGPIGISLSGTVSDLGNARRFEFLRVPGGSLAGVDLRLASLTAGDYTLCLSFEKDGSDDVVAVEARKRVTMTAGGVDGESPLNAAQVTNSGSAVDAWSDGNAPTDPTLCYYSLNRQFRTPALSSGEFEFAGGRFLMTKSTMWPKTFSPAVLRFPRGLEVMDQSFIRINDAGVKVVEIDGPVAFSGSSTVNPAGGENAGESRVSLLGSVRSDSSAVVAVQPTSGARTGFFCIAGDADCFLGTISVRGGCGYAMGGCGLPNGTLSLATNAVLRLPALASPGAVPEVKNLSFGGGAASAIEVACDGADHGAVRVTGTFSASVPPRVVLAGALPHEVARFEVLRAPAGQMSLASFSPVQSQIGSLDIEWLVAEEAGEQVLVAKITPSCTILTLR